MRIACGSHADAATVRSDCNGRLSVLRYRGRLVSHVIGSWWQPPPDSSAGNVSAAESHPDGVLSEEDDDRILPHGPAVSDLVIDLTDG